MLRSKSIDTLCLGAMAMALVIALLFFAESQEAAPPGYETRLFDKSRVHTIDIRMEDWDAFLELEEEYVLCDLTIDGEDVPNVGLRTKGNNSRRLTAQYGHDRYSLKVEFDHFGPGSYHGLDKLCLDASFQDNSYLKTWLTFDMMASMGVPTPLCSWVWVTVNGQDWGLFLAIEEPEDAFARRVWGPDHGKLYKPDYKLLRDENADVHLRYTDDRFESYDNIFRNAKFPVTDADKRRLIQALKILDSGEELDRALDIEEVLRYFTVQVFVVNLDSYLGKTGHNYFLYEQDGILQLLPWDYNLAFGTYSLGMPDPINDSTLYINYPIDTPAAGEIMKKRPAYHNLMKDRRHFARYHALFDQFLRDYFESGYFDRFTAETLALISPWVRRDPTAFCSYEDFLLGAETLMEFCRLRARSVRGQLEGTIPSTIRGQQEDRSGFVDGSPVWLPDLGEIADLEQ